MARKFLYVIALLIALVLAGSFALSIWQREIAAAVLVPSAKFEKQEVFAANVYENPDMWLSRPINSDASGKETSRKGEELARFQPEFGQAFPGTEIVPETGPETGSETENAAEETANKDDNTVTSAIPTTEPTLSPTPSSSVKKTAPFTVFFVHPTSYFESSNWNAPIADESSQYYARLYVQGMASPFNEAKEIWAPKYRQATFGSFLTNAPEAGKAIEAAYADIEQAFFYFLEHSDKKAPIVLAGHSQGALHILTLLRSKIIGTPLEKRLAAVYAIGWPVSLEHDLEALKIGACERADQAGCLLTWSSFAEPADPGDLLETFSASLGYDGKPRGDGAVLCVNPLTGTRNGEGKAEMNLGTLLPDSKLEKGVLYKAAVPARCDEKGLLLIGEPPEMGDAVLPGNNYHVYDILLFWANLQADVARRAEAWKQGK